MLSQILFAPLAVLVAAEDFSQVTSDDADIRVGGRPWDTIFDGDGQREEHGQIDCADDENKYETLCCGDWESWSTNAWKRRFCWPNKKLNQGDSCVISKQCEHQQDKPKHWYCSFETENYQSAPPDGEGHVCGKCHSRYNPPIAATCEYVEDSSDE